LYPESRWRTPHKPHSLRHNPRKSSGTKKKKEKVPNITITYGEFVLSFD
jgi:hypothetical protein